jgi:hypothetical protein
MKNRTFPVVVPGNKASRSIALLPGKPHAHTADSRIKGWYQKRKRAAQRVRAISGDTVVLAEPGYRGHHAKHWWRHDDCGCLFVDSLIGLAKRAPSEICPYCSIESLDDLSRLGSVGAVRELVWALSSGNVDFDDGNRLGSAGDDYRFVCQTHNFIFSSSFSNFVADPHFACPICGWWLRHPPGSH